MGERGEGGREGWKETEAEREREGQTDGREVGEKGRGKEIITGCFPVPEHSPRRFRAICIV